MASNWQLGSHPFTLEERECFEKLLGPVVESLGGRITLAELESFGSLPENDIWFCWDNDGASFRSVMVTRVKRYHAGLNVLCLTHGAGHLDDFDDVNMARVESLARHYGCTKLQIDGRAGWLRALGSEWTEFSRSIQKDVSDG